ncbi:TPA: hypothetical protein HA244_06660 [Candidatus Micrarchaeota archaeon]|nr:hypothetical protein [Candidatus Micrarchaeota archaeon]
MVRESLAFKYLPTLLKFMPIKYLIREVEINEKFARKEKINWVAKKRLVFDIIDELKQKNLFKKVDYGQTNYNLVKNLEDDVPSSLSVLPLTPEETTVLFDSYLLASDENSIMTEKVSAVNFSANSFIYRFRMGLIKHEDISLFNEGKEQQLFNYLQEKNEDMGRLSKTAMAIIVSEKQHKIFIIKHSGLENIGFGEMLYYFEEKSATFKHHMVNNTFKLLPLISGRSFNERDIESILGLEIGINSDLIGAYRQRRGSQDAFFTVFNPISRVFGTGRTATFSINFANENDEEARDLFTSIYGSFVSIQGEEIEKMFTKFKLYYENFSEQKIKINFTTKKFYSYPPEPLDDDFTSAFKAFVWVTEKLNSPQPDEDDEHNG